MGRPASWLTAALLLACANTAYLSWRYVALRHGWVDPGTGACSWNDRVDCDPVLLSAQARWFLVPNAVLGLGFFLACTIAWCGSRTLGAAQRRWVVDRLALALTFGCLAACWFVWLLVQLPQLCPLCPWNHALTLVALVAVLRVRAAETRGVERKPAPGFALTCATVGASAPLVWWLASGR